MFTISGRVMAIGILGFIPSANAQSFAELQTECFRTKVAVEKIVACGYTIQRASDPKMLQRLFLRRGHAFAELGRHTEAIADFSATIRLAPQIAGYYDNRHNSYRASGMLSEALADANVAIQLAPDYSFVYRSRALTLEAMRQYEPAINDYNRAIFIEPKIIGLVVERARIKAKSGRVKEAISELTRIIETDEKNSLAFKERGMAYWMDGNYFAAKQDLIFASISLPSDPDIQRTLAAIASRVQPEPQVSPPLQPRATPPATSKSSSGSAFRIATGQFVTNHHVVDSCSTLKVDGKPGGRVVASDPTRDLALVSLANDHGDIAGIRTTRIQLNETITTAGFPMDGAFSGIAVTNGTISRLSGLKGDTGEVQISAPVQPGNSGGPLLDTAGNVIGVVSSKLNALKVAGVSGDIPQNVNFAINGATLRAFLDAKDVNYKEAGKENELTGVQVAARTSGFTVLIECQR